MNRRRLAGTQKNRKHAFARGLRNNGLSLTYLGLFLICLGALSWTGWRTYCKDQEIHNQAGVSYPAYLWSSPFLAGGEREL